ncbi:MAG: response regulator [Clostridiales bacterium]
MNDIKVLIVDDEYLIRNLLKLKINWKDFGMDIVGEASSAREALELIEKTIPDIILADICMPFMDGIEFSKIVLDRFPHIKIVIVTGYDEFEYAKRSIKIGIDDFILKPINSQEIRKVVLDLKYKINLERDKESELENLKIQLKEKLFYELTETKINLIDIKDRFECLKININEKNNFFHVAIIEICSSNSDFLKRDNENVLLIPKVFNDINENFTKKYAKNKSQILSNKLNDFVNIFLNERNKIIILNTSEKIDLIKYCEDIKKYIIDKYNCFVTIGIGNKLKGIENIKTSYQEACKALDYMIVIGKDKIINFCNIYNNYYNENNKWEFESIKLDELIFYMENGLKIRATEIIDNLFSEFTYNKYNNNNKIRLEVFNVLSKFQQLIVKNKNSSNSFQLNSNNYDLIYKIDNIPEFKIYLKEIVYDIIEKMHNADIKKVNRYIEDIQDYLKKNLNDSNISLSSVAQKFFISPSHLSKLFKQETEKTFIKYLRNIRMEKAIKLLRETDLKAYQIADRIGLEPHYLSIIFKKYTGVSINDFRQSQKIN